MYIGGRWEALLLVLLTMVLPATAFAQSAPRVRLPAQPVRMQIREGERATQTHYSYAIVGSVSRSGVYHSGQPRITIEELIRAAGGASSDSGYTAKIYRSERSAAVQMQFAGANPQPVETLEPGDVLILSAVSTSPPGPTAGPETVPIACVGLSDEPVVLHLDAQVPNLEELLRRLLQPAELAQSTRVVGPSGRLVSGRFIPGTVVQFDRRFVDRAALAHTPPFPVALPLNSRQVSQSPVPLSEPQAAHERSPADDPLDISRYLDNGAASRPVAPLSFGAPGLPESHEIIPLPPPASLLTAQVTPDLPGLSNPVISPVESSPPLPRIVSALEVSPQPIPAEAIGSVRLQQPPTVDGKQAPGSNQATAGGSSMWPLTLGVTLLAVVCMGLSVFWARWDTQQLAEAISRRANIQASAGSRDNASAPETEPESPLAELLQGALPMIEEPVRVTGTWPLHGTVVGHRRVRIDAAHEHVSGPHFGKTEGRKARSRVIVGRARMDERALRQSLRAGIEPIQFRDGAGHEDPWERTGTDDSQESIPGLGPSEVFEQTSFEQSSIAAADTIAAPSFEDLAPEAGDSDTYDIVQPGEPLLHRQAKSALERALRTLDSEKRI